MMRAVEASSSPPSRGRRAAFFDLDGTLLTCNSGALWMARERRLGRISRWQMAEATLYLLAYRLTSLDMEQLMTKALRTVVGEREENVRRWTHHWFYEEVISRAAPGAYAVLDQHRRRGDLLVLLTSSSPYESEAAERFFNLDATICTRYEVKQRRFTGAVVRPVCYGQGKVALAERFADTHGVELAQSYFYTDSFSDLPMLERVGHPRVVNPDLRLRLITHRRGYELLDWR
jgi:HAD superfamily hydrolase (TIGR01490 family)